MLERLSGTRHRPADVAQPVEGADLDVALPDLAGDGQRALLVSVASSWRCVAGRPAEVLSASASRAR